MDNETFHGTDDLQICFKEGLPHVMKIANKAEYKRATQFLSVLAERGSPQHQNIIPIEPVVNKLKYFIFMPLYPITLVHLPFLPPEVA